ncbi:MAG TPA: ABC transporter substrate-binding protein [Stellaceae bacterium]|nr:ABC transporter substrate-binding protein [Stellaceae bacterium]
MLRIPADFLKRRVGFIAAATVAIAVSFAAHAENGVSADKIVFGQAAALDGPAAALGQGMREGILAAFTEANKGGGVKGHRLELVSRDDGYDPNKSIQAAKQLIDQDKVFALIGSVGTPTSAAVQPIATDAGVPFIGAFTGAEFLRTPYKANVVNVRASYFQETETMVEHLTKDLGISRIAIFYQDDGFGQAGLAGVKRALDRRKMALVAEGAYERNTTAVKRALLTIRQSRPEAVIMIGAYQPCAEFIKVAHEVKLDAVFVNISFVGSDALAKELGHDGTGVVVTQVVPFPTDTSIGLVARYQAAHKALKADATPGFVSLEGYMVGRLVVMALEKLPGNAITRANLLDVISHSNFDLGGVTLSYGADNNRGSDRVFLTVIQSDGRFRHVERLTKAGS